MKFGVTPALSLTHLIPRERLSEDYLLRLIESVAYSGIILRSLRPATQDGLGPRRGVKRLADALRKIRMPPRDRRFASAVARGESKARQELGI